MSSLEKNTKYCCKGLSAFQLLRARGATEALLRNTFFLYERYQMNICTNH